ncbi:GLUG motif-containing protein [Syntrophomonas wolfei]|uniref:Surface proteins containing Ig-like domains-like n=1 Tax=Syntrophomonas wolfei subsp. wolfei (strain DSM 2245B / Goettingen) TaxID=335541 RepID=Q0AY16_SYNWW|nr:GLUG motif-containing protein [Syntrophomonas wolfei]ABI68388.1 surface proteins containing Ig-like domains-like [Syntrophomonas wolfei subsp. wolfei str. Goettingen G311]
MTGNKINGITRFLKRKRSFYPVLLAMIFLLNTSIAAYALPVEAPTADPPAGTYGGKQNVELKTETVAASVYYTTDGADPTTSSTLYTNLIEIPSNMTIKAIATDGTDSSSISTFEYVLFAGGDGSVDNPYQVATAEQLNNVRYHLDKHFIQTEDINLNIAPYNEDTGWEPIGNEWYQFTGTFDGNGKIISKLTIKSTGRYVGLFGFTNGSHIKNVKLENVNVTGDYQVGSLVGDNKYGEITNSYATGAVTGTDHVGGLVGENYFGTITRSYATVTVTGTNYVGGLVASNDCGEITNSYATGAVTGTDHVGGLVGENWGTITCSYATGAVTGTHYIGGLVGDNKYGEITNSYATGAVTGTNYVGGLVGWNGDSTISYTYATGTVKGTSDVGGLVGINDQGTVSKSYWDTTISGTAFSAGGEGVAGKSTEDMKLQGTYVDWDFADIWNIKDGKNDDYPFLKNNPPGSFVKSTITVADVVGGTATVKTNPALEAAEGLTVTVNIANIEAGKRFKSITVIDVYNEAVTITTVTAGKSYTFNMPANDVTVTVEVEPILFAGGSGTEEDPYQVATAVQLDSVRYLLDKHFKQTADIDLSSYNTGLGWEPIGDWDSPFIGAFDGKYNTISNLTINRSTTDYVGLFGFAEGAQIKNVKLENVNVTGSEGVGGLVGENSGTITNSYATGAVTGVNYYVGGLVGWNYGEIANSYASGTIAGTEDVGGLVGGNDGEITNSYASGTISGTEYVGGLVGINIGAITNSYTTGAVTGTGNIFGGLVGINNQGTVTNSYWDTDTSGTKSSAGGTGKTEAQMKQQETYEGWDFIDIWNIEGSRNNGYPFLKNNPPVETLISITSPSAITGIANGTTKTAAALGLPAKVTLVTNGGNAEADVSWDVAACSYNPAVTTEQTFTVSGTVTLPTGVVNPNSVPLTTSISVTVNARPSPPPPWYPVSGVTLDKSSLTLEVNGPAQKLAATVQPSYASNPYVYWNSSDTEVARVDYTGLVTPVAPGQAIITATTSEGGKTASCTVEVLARIEGIKLNKASTTITEGNSETLKATLIPENSKQNISWSSDDSSIATVDSEGLVTGISPGTTFITVRTVEGDFSANCTVTVMATITATAEETIVLHDEPVSINIPPEVEATIEVTPGSTMPQVNINSSTALGTVEIQIPEGTIASSPDDWDGTLKLPTISSQPSVNINGASQVNMVIVLGLEDEQISFSQAVRILIPGQAQQQVGYIRNGVFTPITRILSADRQDVADSEIPADGDGKIDVDSDLAVWTKHFTEFVTYTPISNPEPVSYTVSLSSNYAKAGTVSGDGTFYGGSLITVRAQAQSGYVFDNWSENGCMLSRDSVYSFNLGNSSRQLQANFVREFQEISITDATKPRIITFSHPVLPGEQNLGNIYVATDINGDNKVEGVIVAGVSGNNCQISVKPPGGQWLAGASYYLILEPGLQSALNKTLGIRTRMKFTVE